MFQKITLKKNGWHARLQEWTFGSVPYKNNFCPFFWLTIFCILVFPFVGTFRGVAYLVRLTASLFRALIYFLFYQLDKLSGIIDKLICIPVYDYQVTSYVEKIDDHAAYLLYKTIFEVPWFSTNNNFEENIKIINKYGNVHQAYHNIDFYDLKPKKRKKLLDKWEAWKSTNDNWDSIILNKIVEINKRNKELEKVRCEIEERKQKEKSEREKRIREKVKQRRKLFSKLVQYTKCLLFLAFGTVGIYVLYYLGVLGLLIYENWDSIVNWTLILLGIAGLLLGAIVFIILLCVLVKFAIKFFEKCNLSMPSFLIPSKYIKAPFLLSRKVAVKVFNFVTDKIDFFVIFVKTLKEDNCPPIEWE